MQEELAQPKRGSEDSLYRPLKEVIQPHFPVGLPCYDLVPVIGLTLGASLPYGLGERLRVKPTPMT